MRRGVLAPRDQRALMLGVMCILGLVGVFRVVPAWRAWRAEARAEAIERLSEVAHADAVLGGFADALDTLEARTRRVRALGPGLLTGDTPAEAGSMLSGLLAELSRQTLTRLDAIDIHLDTSKTYVLPRVTAEIQATADITGLASFVQALERGPTLLAVRRLEVRPQNPDTPADQVETLAIRLAVEGVALVRAAKDSM